MAMNGEESESPKKDDIEEMLQNIESKMDNSDTIS